MSNNIDNLALEDVKNILKDKHGYFDVDFNNHSDFTIRQMLKDKLNTIKPSEVREKLEKIIGVEKIQRWMNLPNPVFNGKTPNQLIQDGNITPLNIFIEMMEKQV